MSSDVFIIQQHQMCYSKKRMVEISNAGVVNLAPDYIGHSFDKHGQTCSIYLFKQTHNVPFYIFLSFLWC